MKTTRSTRPKQSTIVVIAGPNGVGKSTALRIIAGIEPASAGLARIATLLHLRPKRVLRCAI
jgi:ABC-type sulfate/molybdate transport systems ATPase subunit